MMNSTSWSISRPLRANSGSLRNKGECLNYIYKRLILRYTVSFDWGLRPIACLLVLGVEYGSS